MVTKTAAEKLQLGKISSLKGEKENMWIMTEKREQFEGGTVWMESVIWFMILVHSRVVLF